MVVDVTSAVDAGSIFNTNSDIPETAAMDMTPRGTQADLNRCYDYCAHWGGSQTDIETCRDACRDMIRTGIPPGNDGSPFNRVDPCRGGIDRWRNPCPIVRGVDREAQISDEGIDFFASAQDLYDQASQTYKDVLGTSASTAANGGIGAGTGQAAQGNNDSGSNTTLYVVGGLAVAGLLIYLLTK